MTATPPWAQGSADRWANAAKPTYVTDLTRASPAEALSPGLRHGKWKVIPYETLEGLAGKMIWCSPMTDAPEVRIALPVAGWHAIFIGLFSTSEAPSVAWVRLDSDPAPVCRRNASTEGYGNFADLYFKAANLRGNSLVIRQQFPAQACGCGVGYIKLIPLSPEEIDAITADARDARPRRLIATNDGFSPLFYHRPTTREALLAQVEPLRNSDFGTLVLHSFGADKVSYPSKHGHNPGLELDDLPREGDRHCVEAIRTLAAKGINPLKTLIDGAHDAGLKVHVGVRPAGWSFFEPYAEFWETPFYKENPGWRCVDRDGTPVTRMSWAVPEVRRHLIDLLMEMVGFGADGAHIVFNRGFPLVLYEEPFVAIFRARHGEDPRQIAECDPRIHALRVEIVTGFLRELRAELDALTPSRGGVRLPISAMVLGCEHDNLIYGLDLRALVAAGLLDELYVYPWDFGGEKGQYDLAFFREICAPRGVPFFPSLYTGYHKGPALVREALSYYEAGAAGVTSFDAVDVLADAPDLAEWLSVARFGHVEEMRARVDQTHAPVRYHTFRKLGNQVRNGRYGPYWGG